MAPTKPLPVLGSPLRDVLESLADNPGAIPPYEKSHIRVTTRVSVAAYCDPWLTEPQTAGGQQSPPYDHVYVLKEKVRERIIEVRERRIRRFL